MKKIGLLTSGGDVPGLNAAIRSVVITAEKNGLEVTGIHDGFEGLIDGNVEVLTIQKVRNIGHLGGTILKSSRSERFATAEGMEAAGLTLSKHTLQSLIVIGGDGTFRGIREFVKRTNISVIGIPKTIDNDIDGIDSAIGFDTALNTVVQSIDKLRDTAESHNRMFLVEVMGREAGFLACYAGIAAAAEGIMIPESNSRTEELAKSISEKLSKQEGSLIIVVAEGDEHGGVYNISQELKKFFPSLNFGVCVLGHIQRGGSPSFYDRFLGTKLGFLAVEEILKGTNNVMIGYSGHSMVKIPFEEVKRRNLKMQPVIKQMLNTLAYYG